MARLRTWIGRLMEARRGARDAKLFARIVDERAARRQAGARTSGARTSGSGTI
jgi:hypothetical protein